MELATRETNSYVRGSTEKKNPLRRAVTRDLRFGSTRLSNVVFVVLSDKALYVGPLKYRIRGIFGFPVLRALGQVGISAGVWFESKRRRQAQRTSLIYFSMVYRPLYRLATRVTSCRCS